MLQADRAAKLEEALKMVDSIDAILAEVELADEEAGIERDGNGDVCEAVREEIYGLM